MSTHWFDSSRQIFWDTNQHDLTIPSSLYCSSLSGNTVIASSATVSTLKGNTLFASSATVSTLTGNSLYVSSFIGNTLFASSATVSTLTGNSLLISSIGINCNAPQYFLDVNGIANFSKNVTFTNYNGATIAQYYTIQNSQTTSGVNVASTFQIVGYNNADAFYRPIVTITPTGKVGINCNTPAYALDINGTIRTASINAVAATTASNILYAGGFTTLNNTASLSFQTQGGGGTTIEQRIVSRFTNGDQYGLSIDDVQNSKLDNLRVGNGKVGINCNAPAYALDINGTIRAASINAVAATNVSSILYAGGFNTESNSASLSFITQSGGGASIEQRIISRFTTGDQYGLSIDDVSGGYLNNLRVGNGKVGINCNAPAYELDVNGIIHARAVTVDANIRTYGKVLADLTSQFGQSNLAYLGDCSGGFSMITNNAIYVNGTVYSSDQRVKQNIENANLSMCYSTFQQLNLRRFRWDSNYYPSTIKQDRTVLGFVAQEVKTILPKIVYSHNDFITGLSSFHAINPEQIYYTHVGATKKLMELVEQQGSTIRGIQQELSTLRG
jgi:hypothetical protein